MTTNVMSLIFLFGLLSMGCASSMGYQKSNHFDGSRFFNSDYVEPRGFFDFLKWQFQGGKKPWPKWVENTAQPKVAGEVGMGEAHITWINHATSLVQLQGLNVLTDPIYSQRASPLSWLGPQRVRAPGLEFEQLPPIHVVVVSHNHYDHMDLETLKRINDKFHPIFIVPLANAKLLQDVGISRESIHELDWWESYDFSKATYRTYKVNDARGEMKVTLVPAQHWSARSMGDRNRALWGGYVIESGGVKVYFAGDTGYGSVFKQIRDRVGALDIALLPIGSYEPRWFMKSQHLNPDDAVLAHLDLQPKLSLAIHHECFHLANEGIDEPARDLRAALNTRKVESFHIPLTGETFVYRNEAAMLGKANY